jgi:hypothetical protein
MELHPDHQRSPNAAVLGTALAIAPAAVGCAVGLLLADRLKGRPRQRVASGLFAISALATLPLAIDYLGKTLDHPAFRRSRQRKIDCIRQGGAFLDADVVGGEEYFIDREA